MTLIRFFDFKSTTRIFASETSSIKPGVWRLARSDIPNIANFVNLNLRYQYMIRASKRFA
jgi:hypothetical protein